MERPAETAPAVVLEENRESARQAAARKGNAGAVMNGANEAAVALFLERKISFLDIPRLVGQAMDSLPYQQIFSIDDVLACDRAARQAVYTQI